MRPHAISRWWIASISLAPLLLVAAAACTTARPAPWGGGARHDAGASREALRLVTHADDLVERGQARAALAAYERLLREQPGDPAGASALYGLGRLQAGSSSALRNYRAAHRAFSRLLADFPDSRWQAEARA